MRHNCHAYLVGKGQQVWWHVLADRLQAADQSTRKRLLVRQEQRVRVTLDAYSTARR